MQQRISQALYAATALLLWLLLSYLLLVDDVGRRAVLDIRTFIAVALLVVAPAATCIPLARWVGAPLYEAEGIIGWAGLGFMLAFVTPSNPVSLGEFVAFLVTLTIAIATVASMTAYLIGLRVLRGSPRRYDFLRARRQGYLAAFGIVSMIVLSSVGTLTFTSATMMLVIIVLAEMLALAHTGRNLLRIGLGPRRTGGVRPR